MQSLILPTSSTTHQLRALLLSYNQLELTVGTFTGLHWLGRLNISHNDISTLFVGVFKDLVNLFDLDLSHNKLSIILPGTFDGLKSLQTLDLSNNELQLMQRDTLQGLLNIRNLIITDNDLNTVSQDAFEIVPTLLNLYSDAYKFCCIATQVEVCTPEADAFSSCEDLMANYALQISIWVLGSCALVGNFFVVIWRLMTEKGKVSSFLVINLGMSDFLMGVYMLIVASVDVHYRGTYIIHADDWRSSALCTLAGILAMLGSEVSEIKMDVVFMQLRHYYITIVILQAYWLIPGKINIHL